MKSLVSYILLFSCFAQAQYITVLDSITKAPVPLVHIYNGKIGLVTNSEGISYWRERQTDSITFSCLGYASKKISPAEISDTLYLMPKALELMPVMVSNRKLTAEEIIDSVKANTKKNVDFGLSSSEVFVRSISIYDTEKIGVEMKKSTIPELDQSFVDEILEQSPKTDKIKSFSKSKWLRDSGGLKYHKLVVLKATKLQDSLTDHRFDSMEKTVNEVLKKRVKKDSYFKVKSGPLITVKMDNNIHKTDSVAQEENKLTPKQYAKNQLGSLQRLANKDLFSEKEWVLPFLEKPNKYQFKNEDIVYDLGVPTYKIAFASKKEKGYNGYLLIDVEDFGVYKAYYKSNSHVKRIKLFGLFYERQISNKTYTFIKNHIGKYTLYNIKEAFQEQIGLKRPIKIIEKNKIVKGKNRQNVVSMDFNVFMKNKEELSVYFNSFESITKKAFDSFQLKHSVLPKDLYSMEEMKKHIADFPVD